MAKIIPERMSAQIEGDFVIFLIGMRINKLWKIHKWLTPFIAMARMQRELKTLDVTLTGCLETRLISSGMTVQYWRSFDHLEAFAKDQNGQHLPAWKRFNKMAQAARGDVGIWHETFLVKAGAYETLYSGMPQQGLGKAGGLIPVTGHMSSARGRVQASDERTEV